MSSHTFCTGKILSNQPCTATVAAAAVAGLLSRDVGLKTDITVSLQAASESLRALAAAGGEELQDAVKTAQGEKAKKDKKAKKEKTKKRKDKSSSTANDTLESEAAAPLTKQKGKRRKEDEGEETRGSKKKKRSE
uniref:Uncharacterized protein n=1 Tax=Tetraselmis chuii TaxID=63592 RepID=A0A7S1X8K5_9CHLO|mmetsp:Transcript_43987/g.78568  ORF Transcript_43987/g.78568 Transcript_43987/m.78568 type:complete len:135 (+) Transcript_43987:297-701(+)